MQPRSGEPDGEHAQGGGAGQHDAERGIETDGPRQARAVHGGPGSGGIGDVAGQMDEYADQRPGADDGAAGAEQESRRRAPDPDKRHKSGDQANAGEQDSVAETVAAGGGHPRLTARTDARIPVSVLVMRASRDERQCATTKERWPTRQRA